MAVAAPPAAADPRPCDMPPERLLRNFANIAFGSEHQPGQGNEITKWRTPIRYAVIDRVGVEHPVREDLDTHMRLLHRLTGVSIKPAARRSEANFLVIFTRLAWFRRTIARRLATSNLGLLTRLSRADCIGVMHRSSATNEIVRATAIIPVDHARERGLLHHCIVEETTQLMGLPNDSDDADFSIFNDRSRRDDLGCQDKVFLRLLYHPDLKLGMPKARAIAAARRVLQTLAPARPASPAK